MDTTALKAQIVAILTGDAGLSADAVADAIVLAVQTDLTPVAVDPNQPQPTAPGSRDETGDSIDPATGTLTAEAVAKRAADAAQVASDEADDEAAQAELDIDTAEEAGDETALAAAKAKLSAAQAKKTASAAKLAGDQATLDADTVSGAAGDDSVTGAPAPDSIMGGNGDDSVTTAADLGG